MAENDTNETKDTGDAAKDSEAKLGDAGKKALAEERKARKAAESKLAELQAWKDERELGDARSAVISEAGLSDELGEALVGSTREELEAHAEKLKALIPKPDGTSFSRPKEKLRPGASNDEDEAPDYSQIAERIDS